jgi:RNA polymerase primary sigma factor
VAKKERKSKKAKDMNQTEVKNVTEVKSAADVASPTQVQHPPDGQGPAESAKAQETEQLIKLLVAKGKKRGFLTYEEMNNALPDDAVSSNRLERLLATLDEMGISLIDENDAEARAVKADEEFEEMAWPEEGEVVEEAAEEEESSRRT